MSKCFAIDPNKEYRFYPKEVRELIDGGMAEEAMPFFIIKPLTARAAASVEDNMAETSIKSKGEDSTMRLKSGTTVIETLTKGLAGWENFKLPNGEDAPWRHNNNVPKPENFDYIPAKWRREIAEAITEGSDLSEHAVKNSD